MNNSLFLLFIYFLTTSCSEKKYPKEVTEVLELSGKNRTEIEGAINHFIEKKDSLKIEAVFFLVKNMKNKFSIIAEDKNNSFYKVIKSDISETQAWNLQESKLNKILDSIQLKEGSINTKIVKDIDVITKDFLISNVENSFEAWKNIQGFIDYSFEDFCEYVLPYRLGNEPLTNWRKQAFDRYKHLLDSIHDPIELAKSIVKNSKVKYNIGMGKYPLIPTFIDVDIFKWGSCEHLSAYLTFSLRALGIPSSVDNIPTWANRNSGHVWNVVMNKKGQFEDFGFMEDGTNDVLYKISKIYRTTFSIDEKTKELNSSWKDVTYQYKMPMYNICFPIPSYIKIENKKIFLCTFDNFDWIPVAIPSRIENGYIYFDNVACGIAFKEKLHEYQYKNEGKGIVFVVKFSDKKQAFSQDFSSPFILTEKGECKFFPSRKDTQTIVLYRKYPKYQYIDTYAQQMVGGKISISNFKNFKTEKIIFRINKKPKHPISEISLPKKIYGRYIRYISPINSWINISELQCFFRNKKLNGTPFSLNKENPEKAFFNICDGDFQSFYTGDSDKTSSICIDFGRRIFIDKILFSPRTDENDIFVGNIYELFYWEKKWISLGRKIAKDTFIEYHNVPKGTLLLLMNCTKGVEQRIFTYENNQQIWW